MWTGVKKVVDLQNAKLETNQTRDELSVLTKKTQTAVGIIGKDVSTWPAKEQECLAERYQSTVHKGLLFLFLLIITVLVDHSRR